MLNIGAVGQHFHAWQWMGPSWPVMDSRTATTSLEQGLQLLTPKRKDVDDLPAEVLKSWLGGQPGRRHPPSRHGSSRRVADG